MPTSKLSAPLAVDANALLSALIGGRARDILLKGSGQFVTTEQSLAEVREYLPRLAAKYHLNAELLSAVLVTLPVDVRGRDSYAEQLDEARQRIGSRDPNDVDLLALALHLKAAVWSNDRDFRDAGVELWTTAQEPDYSRKL